MYVVIFYMCLSYLSVLIFPRIRADRIVVGIYFKIGTIFLCLLLYIFIVAPYLLFLFSVIISSDIISSLQACQVLLEKSMKGTKLVVVCSFKWFW